MKTNFIAVGAWTLFVGVGVGAFGAHALKDILGAEGRPIYETGVIYHLVHGLAILATGILQQIRKEGWLDRIGWLFLGGIILFSGSLYALAISGIKVLGAITPLGGVCFLLGWALLGLQSAKNAVK